jgi:hypothetical protein
MERITNDFAKSMGLQDDAPIVKATNIGRKGNALFPPGAEGSIFETAINAMTKNAKSFEAGLAGDTSALWDFEESGNVNSRFKKKFGYSGALKRADAKRTLSQEALNSIGNKIVSTLTTKSGQALDNSALAQTMAQYASGPLIKKKGKAGGFIPSFSALHQAVARERSAGVPMNRIRVGSSRSLASGLNPMGLGVYNTQDEPGGLGQGIRRSLAMGTNPKSAGSIPNFAPAGGGAGGLMASQGALLGVTMGLNILSDALRANTDAQEEGTSSASAVADALQNALLTGGALAAVGSFAPRGLTDFFNRDIGSFGRRGGGGIVPRGPRSRTAFAERLPGISDLQGSGFGQNAARRFNVPGGIFSRGISYERGALFQRGGMQMEGGAIGNVQRTPSRLSALGGAAGRLGGRIGGAAGRGFGAARRGIAAAGPLGVAAGGLAAFTAISQIADSRIFNEAQKEFEDASKAFASVAEATEKNISKLTKFGEATEQAIATFNDSNATMAQVNKAQDELNKALRELPSNLRKNVAGLADPEAIQGAIQDSIAEQQKNRDRAQLRQDTAGFTNRNDRKMTDVLGNLERIFMSDFEVQRQSQARQDEFGSLAERIVNSGDFATRATAGGQDRVNFGSRASDFAELLGRFSGGTVTANDANTKKLLELGEGLGMGTQELNGFINTLKAGGDAAADAAKSMIEVTASNIESLRAAKAEASARALIIRENLADVQRIKAVQQSLVLEAKVRKEFIKITTDASKGFLTDRGNIQLQTRQKGLDAFSTNVATFGSSFQAASNAFGAARSLRGTQLGGRVAGLLQTGSRGFGQMNIEETREISQALSKAAEDANAADAKKLDTLATQLEQLNATSDRIAKINFEQQYELARVAQAQIAAARQAQKVRSFGGVAAIKDPTALNPILSQLQGAQQAGAIASRAGSRMGVDRANVNRFDAIQQLLGGNLEGTRFLKPAQDAARRVAFTQMSQLNRATGLGLSRRDIDERARLQASTLFKGSVEDQLNNNLESLTGAVGQLRAAIEQAALGGSIVNNMQMGADADRQQRLANFNNASGLRNPAEQFGGLFRSQAMLASSYDVEAAELARMPDYSGMGHGTQRATSTHSMRDNISQREGNRSRMTKIDAPNTYNIYLSGIKVNNPEMQKTVQQMMKNPAMRRVMNQLPQY